ncbi:MAG: hypothetical protein ACJ8BE_14695, partial [Microvirga sp.]
VWLSAGVRPSEGSTRLLDSDRNIRCAPTWFAICRENNQLFRASPLACRRGVAKPSKALQAGHRETFLTAIVEPCHRQTKAEVNQRTQRFSYIRVIADKAPHRFHSRHLEEPDAGP